MKNIFKINKDELVQLSDRIAVLSFIVLQLAVLTVLTVLTFCMLGRGIKGILTVIIPYLFSNWFLIPAILILGIGIVVFLSNFEVSIKSKMARKE